MVVRCGRKGKHFYSSKTIKCGVPHVHLPFLEFLTLRLVHTELLATQYSGFPTPVMVPTEVSDCGFLLRLRCDSLHLPLCLYNFGGHQFAL